MSAKKISNTETQSIKTGLRAENMSLLQLFFDVYFFSFLVPFRVKWDSATQTFFLVSWKLHSVICLGLQANTVHFLCRNLISVYNRFWGRDLEQVSNLFNFLHIIGFIIFVLLFFKSVWFDREALLKVITFTARPVKKSKLICNFGTLIGILCFFGYGIHMYFGSAFFIKKEVAETAGNSSDNSTTENSGNLNILGINLFGVLRIVEAAVGIHSAGIYVLHFLLLALGCSLLETVKAYRQDLSLAFSTNDIMKAYQAYRSLKSNVLLTNKLFGGQLFGFCLATTAFYAQLPEVLMGFLTDHPVGTLYMFIVLDMSIIFVAAEFNTRVSQASLEWQEKVSFDTVADKHPEEKRLNQLESQNVAKYFQILDNKLKFMTVKNEMGSEPVALSCRFFAVTYGLLGSVLGVIVTYSIIIYQMRSEK